MAQLEQMQSTETEVGRSTGSEHPHTQRHIPRLKLEDEPRKKTLGEHTFNLLSYGGIVWGLNEAITTWFAGKVQPASNGKAAGTWFKGYDAFSTKHSDRIAKGLGKVLPFKYASLYEVAKRSIYILYSCVGGTAVLPLIKLTESHKSGIVRSFDWMFHGNKANTDPDMIRSHEEMDKAPPQTWKSLIEGRLVVMGTAIALDFTTGNEKSPTTKLLENTPLKSVSNMERMGNSFVRSIMFWAHPDEKIRGEITKQFKKAPHAPIKAAEGKFMNSVGRGAFFFILSGALTVLFYVSSKLFAFGNEKHKEEKEEIQKIRTTMHQSTPAREESPSVEQPSTEKAPSPSAHIQTADNVISRMSSELDQSVSLGKA